MNWYKKANDEFSNGSENPEEGNANDNLKEHLTLLKNMHERGNHFKDFYYSSVPDLLLKEGTKFESQPLTEEELAYLDKIKHATSRYRMKQCFYNAQDLASMFSDIKYVEGYLYTIIPFEHAWNTLNGKVIDFTIKKVNGGKPVLGIIPEGWEYHGITLPTGSIRSFWAKHGLTDSQLSNYRDHYPLLKEKFIPEA